MVDLGPPALLHLKGRLVPGPHAQKEEDDVITYSSSGRPVAVVKIMEPVSPMLNYYEIKIVNKGESCCISVGIGALGYPQGQQPGWMKDSIGYHADDGRLFHGAGFGDDFGPTCTTGDRMGCGIEFDQYPDSNHVGVFFTKNGSKIGSTQKFKRPLNGLYPLFGFHSKGESIKYLGHWHISPETLHERMSLECSPSTYWIRSNGVRFLNDSLTVEYAGEGGRVQDCALAQANAPLTPTNHYFELEILDSGADGSIAIGLAKLTYPLHKHPGWNAGSIGYHADDGKLFHERGMGADYGPPCTTGDVIGCGIKFTEGVIIDYDDIEDECSSSDSDPMLLGMNPAVMGGGNLFGGGQPPFMNWSGDEDDDSEEEPWEPRLLPPGPLFRGNRVRPNARHNPFGPGFGGFPLPHQNPFGNLVLPPHKEIKPHTEQGKSDSKKKRPKVTVYFTRNSEELGNVECDLPSGGFYPVVAMLSKGEKVKVDLSPISG